MLLVKPFIFSTFSNPPQVMVHFTPKEPGLLGWALRFSREETLRGSPDRHDAQVWTHEFTLRTTKAPATVRTPLLLARKE